MMYTGIATYFHHRSLIPLCWLAHETSDGVEHTQHPPSIYAPVLIGAHLPDMVSFRPALWSKTARLKVEVDCFAS
jgi:hypothetical protein